MDNLPKDDSLPEQSSKQPSGDIFSSPASAYQQATEVPQEQQEAVVEQEIAEPQEQPPPVEGAPPPSENVPPPPPYVEDSRKKYIFIALAIITVIILIFLAARLFLKKPAKPPENVTLTYWGLWEDKDLIQPIFDDYKRLHPNVTVNYVKQDPKQYRERVAAAIERGEGPDIYRFHNTWIPMIYQYLAPMPKNVYSDAEYEKIFYPTAVAELKVGGNYYGIPLEIDGDILGLMMLQNGTKLSQSLFSCTDKTVTTCALEALSFYRKFAEAPNNTWDETLENSIVAFAGGKVGMILAPSWEVYTIKAIPGGDKINFKTAKIPQLPCDKEPCRTVNWATYWVEGVSNRTKNASYAWDLLKYLSQNDTMQKLYSQQVKYRKLFGEPYSRVDLGKSLSDNPYLAPLISSAPTMKSFYFASRTNDGDTGIDSSLIKYLKDAVNSLATGVSPETALKTVDNGLKQVFGRFNISSPAQ
ncbi:extracellular solute-binding protein [Candidatus Gottesmanbacteria bacterium]|nr:extracellular solute-binding protein [Candidatus Gottesmanbacteria bacterium]